MEKGQYTYSNLFLWNIHQCCADGGREDDISVTLLLEYLRSRLSSIKSSIEINFHDITPVFSSVILGGDIRSDSRVDYDDV